MLQFSLLYLVSVVHICFTMTNENDLPLVSNVNDILVSHYMFNFSCSFNDKQFQSSAILFLKPVTKKNEHCACFGQAKNSIVSPSSLHTKENFKNPFKVILDCHKICVNDVEEISLNCSELENLKYVGIDPVSFASSGKLNFVTDKWSLKIWKDINTCKLCFPKLIRISYRAVHEGPSLLWVTDQDKK